MTVPSRHKSGWGTNFKFKQLKLFVCWLFNVPGTGIVWNFHMLSHWDKACRSNYQSKCAITGPASPRTDPIMSDIGRDSYYDYLAKHKDTVTGWDISFDFHLQSKSGRTCNCLSSFVSGVHFTCYLDLQQPRKQTNKQTKHDFVQLVSRPHHGLPLHVPSP